MAHILLLFQGMISTDAFERISIAPVAAASRETGRLTKTIERLCGLGLGMTLSTILMFLL